MKSRNVLLAVALLTSLVSVICWGTECRFFRIECQDGEAPENLAITMDDSGQTFLEFDTGVGNTYSIEATDSLSPPVWGSVWSLTGDGQRATWLTTSGRWSRTFGGTSGEIAYSVQQTSDGGYIVAGSTGSFGLGSVMYPDVYLIKTDANGLIGKRGWSRTFGGTSRDIAYSVQQTSDGGYIVAGYTESFGAGDRDVYLIKTGANGLIAKTGWSRTLGGSNSDLAYCVQQTSDGGYIVAGRTYSFGAGLDDVYLIKTDANGNEVWSRTFGGTDGDWASSVQQTSDGGYIVAGRTGLSSAGDGDVYLIKTDADGNEVWSRTFGGSGEYDTPSVQQTSDGGYIVAGGAEDVYLIKTDADGNEVWSRTFGGAKSDDASSVQQTSDEGFIVAGTTYSFGAGSSDVYLIKTDANGGTGKRGWSRTFGGDSADSGQSVQQTTDGGYIVAGSTYNFGAGGADVYLIKTDANGNAPPPE